jgi:hypothetical protein
MPMDMSALVDALRGNNLKPYQPGLGAAAPKPGADAMASAGSNLGVSPPQGSSVPMQVSDAQQSEPMVAPSMELGQLVSGGMLGQLPQNISDRVTGEPVAANRYGNEPVPGQPMGPSNDMLQGLMGAMGQANSSPPPVQGQPWQMNAPAQAGMAVQPEMGKPMGNMAFPQAEQGFGPAPAPLPMPSMNQASQPPLNPSEQLRSQIGAAMDQFRRPPQITSTAGAARRPARPPSAVLPRRTSVR